MIGAIFRGAMDASELLRKIGIYACWAMTVVATLAYAWARVRAEAAEGLADGSAPALVRRAKVWAGVGGLFAIAAIALSAS